MTTGQQQGEDASFSGDEEEDDDDDVEQITQQPMADTIDTTGWTPTNGSSSEDDSDDDGISEKESMPPIGGTASIPPALSVGAGGNDESGEGDEGNVMTTLETINPPDLAYRPPVLPEDKGPLQLFFEDQSSLDPKTKNAYTLIVVGSFLQINPHNFEPYKSYAVLSTEKKVDESTRR